MDDKGIEVLRPQGHVHVWMHAYRTAASQLGKIFSKTGRGLMVPLCGLFLDLLQKSFFFDAFSLHLALP